MAAFSWDAEPPVLRDPLLLIALEGFVDAGAVAATASMFLRHRWRADRVGRFDRDRFIDYRARRPTVVIDSGEIRRLDWSTIELFAARVDGPRDALLLLGPEPDARWTEFAAAVVDICRTTGVHAAVGLGAYPAASAHTRPVRIVKAANRSGLHLAPDVPAIRGYTGPVGVGSTLDAVLGEHGVPAVELWAEIPHYIAGSPNPPGALAMVRLVAQLMGTTVDTTELEAAAKLHAEQVDEAVQGHPEAIEMLRTLEAAADDEEERLPSGDDIAAEIERFLRAQGD